MAKTKAGDRIRLPNGDEMTLGEALDRGLVYLRESTYYDPPRYFARDREDTVSWEVGKTLYLSRMNKPLPFKGLGGVEQVEHCLRLKSAPAIRKCVRRALK